MKDKISKFVFGSKESKKSMQTQNTLKTTNNKDSISNPYVIGAEGRAEWNDRYMNMAKAVKNWQIASLIISIIAIIQLILIITLSTQSKIRPYIVETHEGIPYNIKPVVGVSDKDQRIINYAINQFVINAKTIISDTKGLRKLLDDVYAYSADETMGYLKDYYEHNNPFDVANKYSVSVNIINSLPIGNNTWQVIWEENKYDSTSGILKEKTKWIGHLTYKFSDVNSNTINQNPFGIYITNINWSQSQ